MSVVAVVAKYKEDITWTTQLDIPIIVYDKSANIPNVGREAETYLRFIITNYDNLPDHVVFLQGNPFDHLTVKTLKFLKDSIKTRRSADVTFLNTPYSEVTDSRCVRTTSAFETLFAANAPSHVVFSTGAQYIVPSKNIRSRPKAFYETISAVMVDFDKHSINGCLVCPWTIERLWPYIFDPSIPHNSFEYNSLR